MGLEFIVVEFGEKNNSPLIVEKLECEVEKREGTVCFFKLNYNPEHPGSFNYGIRLYPKNPGLPHRQDFKYVKWL